MKKTCEGCKEVKYIKAKGNCQNCWHKYKRKYNLNFFLRTRYTELVQRCKNPNNTTSKYYFGKTYCSKEDFLKLFINNESVKILYKNWQDNNFLYTLCPSIDRIDNNNGYEINNIHFITHGENCRKDNETKISVHVFDRNGNYLSSRDCLNGAVKFYKVQQSNAWKVLHGIRKHTCGYVFKIKNKS